MKINPDEVYAKFLKLSRAQEDQDHLYNLVVAMCDVFNKRHSPKASIPTLEDLAYFCTEEGIPSGHIDPFFNYFESNGWKVGRNPMKNWKAAYRGWVSRAQSPSSYRAARVQHHGNL